MRSLACDDFAQARAQTIGRTDPRASKGERTQYSRIVQMITLKWRTRNITFKVFVGHFHADKAESLLSKPDALHLALDLRQLRLLGVTPLANVKQQSSVYERRAPVTQLGRISVLITSLSCAPDYAVTSARERDEADGARV